MRINDPGDNRFMARRPSRRSWLAGTQDNSLARPTDRTHARLRLSCIAIWIVALPVAAILGLLVAGDGLHAAAIEANDRTRTTAVLTADAPKVSLRGNGTTVATTSEVAARWRDADGTTRTGDVQANNGALVGSTVAIWIDSSGNAADPPASSGAAVGWGLAIGGGSWLALGLVLLLTLRLGVRTIDNRRRADWDRDWERVAPIWLRQE